MNTQRPRQSDRKRSVPRTSAGRELIFRVGRGHMGTGCETEAEWVAQITEHFPRFVSFLVRECAVDFRGRILEIAAATPWFSAELSKLPGVVQIVVADLSPKPLRDQLPRLFKLLNAREGKITRRSSSLRLDFPDNHFDFVVCAALLHRSANMVAVLREVQRVLKPGGRFVAVREPVLPLVKWNASARQKAKSPIPAGHFTLGDYREFYASAGLKLVTRRLSVATGFKYYLDKVINGLTHARYAFLATKAAKS